MSYRAWATIVVVVLLIIAGSFYFLGSSGTPRPTTYEDIGDDLGSGTVERADAGFAVTTPPGWTAWEPSTDFQDWWGAGTQVHLWMEPTPSADAWWMGSCAIGEDCTYERMVKAGGEAYCWVVEDTDLAQERGWSDAASSARFTLDLLADQGSWSDVRSTVEDLPTGEASVVRAIDPNGWPQEIRHLNDGQRWYRLLCGVLDSEVEPRAIAETFEFLPPAAVP